MRARRVEVLTAAAMLLVTLAACGGEKDETPQVGSSPSQESVSAPAVPEAPRTTATSRPSGRSTDPDPVAPPSEAPVVAATQAPPPPPHDVSQCRTSQLTIRVVKQVGTAKSGPPVGLIALTNRGPRACALSGWPSVGLTSGGESLSLSVTRVNEPRPPVAMTLEPQRSAFSGMRWRACSPTTSGCRRGDGFRVGAPGSSSVPADLSGFSPTEREGFGISALVIGTLQPTTADIINW